MAAIRHIIQKEVFDPVDESIQGLVNVTKTRKKKKFSFLCLSVNFQDKPPEAYISRVKTVERKVGDKSDSRETYRRVKYWRLPELRLVDGKSVETEVLEFDLHFDKGVFKWIASNVTEKKNFIAALYKVVHKFMQPGGKKPEFANVDEEKLQENLATSSAGNPEDQEVVLVQQDEYQEITAKEEEDLESVLNREKAIQDAASFTEGLSKELTQLDDAIIHSLLGSEEQALELIKYVDHTLDAVNSLENRLSVYDELLSSVRTTMQQLSQQYSGIEVEHANLKALYTEVEDIVVCALVIMWVCVGECSLLLSNLFILVLFYFHAYIVCDQPHLSFIVTPYHLHALSDPLSPHPHLSPPYIASSHPFCLSTYNTSHFLILLQSITRPHHHTPHTTPTHPPTTTPLAEEA